MSGLQHDLHTAQILPNPLSGKLFKLNRLESGSWIAFHFTTGTGAGRLFNPRSCKAPWPWASIAPQRSGIELSLGGYDLAMQARR
jgi:hypothetical protein